VVEAVLVAATMILLPEELVALEVGVTEAKEQLIMQLLEPSILAVGAGAEVIINPEKRAAQALLSLKYLTT
jgi:hypothetical protein